MDRGIFKMRLPPQSARIKWPHLLVMAMRKHCHETKIYKPIGKTENRDVTGYSLFREFFDILAALNLFEDDSL
jgi:hypothetical protein